MSSDDAFLAAAEAIGRHIVADAVWYDGVCSWTGAVINPAQPWRGEYHALEPNLYDGTAGVGLFLSQLAAVTADAAVRRTAVGALRHAVARAAALRPERRDGFHAGSLGIAWAVARGAALLDEEELRVGASTVPAAAPPPRGPQRIPDVILGAAGAVVAQLALADALDEPAFVDDALAAGEDLLAQATVTPHGWSWPAPGRRRGHHLCGLSHGAAGIGWALLELFVATGDARFRAGAAGAFAYERSWLDARSGTWPDLRIGGQRRGAARSIPSPAVGTWCHGEGGIALTRLRAIEVLGGDAASHDAELALETTRRHLASALPYDIEDLTLCHGAAGAAEVLLCGAAALGERWHDAADVAADLGRAAVERYGAASDGWPCGAEGGTTPALFRGLAGIGWWLMRLYDGTIDSPLAMPMLTPVRTQA